MQTLTIRIHDQRAMKAIKTMEQRHALSIVEHATSEIESPALPGKPLSLKEFKNWVASAESSRSVTLKAARFQWAKQRSQLQRLATK